MSSHATKSSQERSKQKKDKEKHRSRHPSSGPSHRPIPAPLDPADNELKRMTIWAHEILEDTDDPFADDFASP
jgi:hypothetical protein